MAKSSAVIVCSMTALCAAAMLAYAGDQKPYTSKDSVEVKATVEEIHPDRSLVLKGENGEKVALVASPDVRNFDQLKVGDEVSIVYKVGIAAQVKPKGTPLSAPEATSYEKRAVPGAKPGGSVGQELATTVKIESVDTSFNTVTFTKSDGITRTVAVEDPEARKFIKTLKPGDPVEIRYSEAVAVSVKPYQR